jgi:predicted permease
MLIESFFQDLRIGLRVLIKEKSFCALAVLVLSLGICGVATMFSVVNGVMLRGFSFPNASRLTGIQVIDPKQSNPFGFNGQIFALDYEEMRTTQTSFELMAAYLNGSTVNATIDGNPQRYTGAYITPDFFRILGVRPIKGRDFAEADNKPGAEKTTIISHQLWQRDFGSEPNIVGKGIVLNGKPATVIGVMPPGFSFPGNEQLWVPLYSEFPPVPRNDLRRVPPAVLGLIKPGVSLEQATSEFTAIAQRLATAFPDTNKQFNTALIEPLIKTFTPRQLQGLLWTMLAFCVGILLIACVNVMNMQFARAALRAKELAVRSSLGATRLRLIRQMLSESLLVATIGAVVGVGLAFYATDLLQAATKNVSNPIPAYITFDIDGMVLAFVVGATVLSAVVSGFVPAWIASRANAVEALKESGRGNTSRTISFITRALVVFQILVTCVLLIGSLLQLKSILLQQQVDYGYDTNSLLTARMGLMDGDYPTPQARKLFYDRLVRELHASPEFENAALTNRFRMAFVPSGPARTEIEGKTYPTDEDRPNVIVENVSGDYFATLGVKILEGRTFAEDDSDTKQPVAIISAGFARKFFGAESPVGRRLRTVANNGKLFGPWRTIVGVSTTVRMFGPFNNPNVEEHGYYVPLYSPVFGPVQPDPAAPQFTTVVVRPRGQVRAESVAAALQREVKKVNPNQPLYFVGTARENQDSFVAQNRIIATMFSIFGLVAVILASVGLYGVTSFSVNQRTQEFGIRMALGADHGRILQMVLRQGAIQLAIGLGLGLGLAVAIGAAAGSAIQNVLFQVSPTDPLTYGAVALLLTVVSALATLVPARRATRVDPMIALRAE